MKGRKELESQLSDGKKTCAVTARRVVNREIKGGRSCRRKEITQRIRNVITEDHIRANVAVTGYLGWHSTRLKRMQE